MTTMGFADARHAGSLLYLAGQIAPVDLRGAGSTICAQTESAFKQAELILAQHGAELSDVIYVTAYLSDPADFDKYHRTWQTVFPNNPARTTVAATILADNALVELSIVARQRI
jgi:2-iminobutanoate/2-iminopropanoate deaminase